MKAINQTHHMSRLGTRKYLAGILMLCGFLICLAGPLPACEPDPPCDDDSDCTPLQECCGGECITECDGLDCMECDGTSGECESDCTDPNEPNCHLGLCVECEDILDCALCEECVGYECVHNCDSSVCSWPNFCSTGGCTCVRCEIDHQCNIEGACHTCVDSECVGCASPTPWCRESDGTCINCDSASAGDCSVTDEDVGFDADDCVPHLAGIGQCYGGGGDIQTWDQVSSTDEDATGPNTEDIDGCATVHYWKCMNYFEGLQEGGLSYDCI